MKIHLIGLGIAIAGVVGILISNHGESPTLPSHDRAAGSAAVVNTDRFALPSLQEVRLQPIAREMEALHSDDSYPEDDVDLLANLFRQYRRAFGQNPVGLNEEIVAVLAGRNARSAAMISPGHPAIDQKGQLLDRWGTPYFFHQQSGREIEIRSAGPDTQLFTGDDVASGGEVDG